ncbi:MAG TPA: polysaccharide lyase family protein [Phycisphaerae bacterium]|nr:polysaccharide lyase family protein [Phycisphaerae bacterium]
MTRKIAAAMVACILAVTASARAQTGQPVTLTQDEQAYTLDNGIIQIMVAKASGDLVSYRYKGTEMLATYLTPDGKPDLQKDPPGQRSDGLNRGMTDHQYGFWSHDAMGPAQPPVPPTCTVTIDPASNNGERAEVSVKGIANGRHMGTGPGAQAGGNFISDIEIRFALARGDSGAYTYCIFTHQPDYAATTITEARFCAKLNADFDWLSAGAKYNKPYPKSQERGEDKYVYTTIQSENPAFGWSSSTKQYGFYLINPSQEYMSGGPTKPEFLGHRDTNPVAAPCVLDYWRSSHYGGAEVDVNAGEKWTKVIGPFFLYANSGGDPETLYKDAQAQAQKQIAQWPFSWVNAPEYAHKDQRSTVTGRIALSDPLMPADEKPPMTHFHVGLTHAAWQAPAFQFGGARGGRGAARGGQGGTPGPNAAAPAPIAPIQPPPRMVDWQNDAKFYQFWTLATPDGQFSIPNVLPGTYTLHAFADGVLGEFAKADITVEAGKPLDLDSLTWTPVRHGKQLWDIGVANRNASEFFMADHSTDLDIALQYARLYPDDITYIIGKSDFHKDWFFDQPPHNTDPAAHAAPFWGVVGQDGRTGAIGHATPRTIQFDLPDAPASGTATLRLAICGGGPRNPLIVAVNNKEAGRVRIQNDGTPKEHQISGMWYEREVPFDAALLQKGTNTLVLTVPEGAVSDGVEYDYLRLELDENAKLTPAP